MARVVVVAFDVEARGKSVIHHGIVSVGVCVGDTDGRVLEKRTWNVAPLSSAQTWEPRCHAEFWSKLPEAVRTAHQVNPMTAQNFAQEFRAYLDHWEKAGPLHLVSDNPAFDVKFIDTYLDIFGLDSMQYASDGRTYRPVQDKDSYIRGTLHYTFDREWVSDSDVIKQVGLDPDMFAGLVEHLPADDAHRIYLLYVAFNKRMTLDPRLF